MQAREDEIVSASSARAFGPHSQSGAQAWTQP